MNVTINGVHIRKSLAKITNRTITGKTEAEAAFEAFKVQLRKAPTVTKDAALTPPMTLGAMLDAYQRDELSQKPAAEDTETMIAAIKRTRLPVPGGAQAFGDWLVNDVTEADEATLGHMFIVARDIAKAEGIAENGFRLIINCNRDGGQVVYHLHMHLVGGAPLGAMLAKH